MAIKDANYQILTLTGGTYNTAQLGNGYTATTVHQIFCLTSGNITITALGGGTATFTLTPGQYVDVLVGSCTVNSGTYAAFRAKFNNSNISKIQWGHNPGE